MAFILYQLVTFYSTYWLRKTEIAFGFFCRILYTGTVNSKFRYSSHFHSRISKKINMKDQFGISTAIPDLDFEIYLPQKKQFLDYLSGRSLVKIESPNICWEKRLLVKPITTEKGKYVIVLRKSILKVFRGFRRFLLDAKLK